MTGLELWRSSRYNAWSMLELRRMLHGGATPIHGGGTDRPVKLSRGKMIYG